MEHISLNTSMPNTMAQTYRKGRTSSVKMRELQACSENFAGIEPGTSRYDLLLLVKKVGSAAGFTNAMINLLDYYFAYTRDQDWEEGSNPIVYQSLSKTALDLGISERQVQRLEHALFEIGALSWRDSGNHRRYGQRCAQTGRIIYAYGVDLTPLAYMKGALERILFEKQEHDKHWMEVKRQISWYRRQIRSVLNEMDMHNECNKTFKCAESDFLSLNSAYKAIAKPIRTYMTLRYLGEVLDEHKSLYDQILITVERSLNSSDIKQMSDKRSSSDDKDVVNYKYTNKKPSNKLDTSKPNGKGFQKSCIQNLRSHKDGFVNTGQSGLIQGSRGQGKEIISETDDILLCSGLQHITLKQTLSAADENFKGYVLASEHITWHDIVDAAYKVRISLGVSQKSWGDACAVLGRTGAAICMVLTSNAVYRAVDPVKKPAGYFNAMIGRARKKELHLHKSIFGILNKSV